MTLHEVLHAHIPYLTDRSTFRDAVDKMDIYQFPALVVVDEDHAPTHVLTEGDLARALQGTTLGELAEQPAQNFGSREPVTAGPDVDVADALHTMLSRGLTILPIVDAGRLIGVVLRVDLMQAILTDRLISSDPGLNNS